MQHLRKKKYLIFSNNKYFFLYCKNDTNNFLNAKIYIISAELKRMELNLSCWQFSLFEGQ
jgi:hypothetical protein